MADDDKVIFDRKTAAVLLEMARWWQTSGMGRMPQGPKTPRGSGVEMRIAETVDSIAKGASGTATLYGGGASIGSEASLSADVEVHNRHFLSVASSKKILIAWITNAWEIIHVIADGCADINDPTTLDGYSGSVDQVLYKTAAGCWALEDIEDC
jgi:hypothetical protein